MFDTNHHETTPIPPLSELTTKSNNPFFKGRGFLNLYDTTDVPSRTLISPSHLNGGAWFSNFGPDHNFTISSTPRLAARFSHAVTKHAPIGEFRQRFNLERAVPRTCPGHPLIPETRDHILHHCSWYVRRWNHFRGGIESVGG